MDRQLLQSYPMAIVTFDRHLLHACHGEMGDLEQEMFVAVGWRQRGGGPPWCLGPAGRLDKPVKLTTAEFTCYLGQDCRHEQVGQDALGGGN